MLKKTSARKGKRKKVSVNIVSIMDVVFIFIFFLLLSAEFVKIYTPQAKNGVISSARAEDMPQVSKQIKIRIEESAIKVYQGFAKQPLETIHNNDEGYSVKALNAFLQELKNKNPDEKKVILRPAESMNFQQLVSVLDAIKLDFSGKIDGGLFPEVVFEN